MKPESFRSSSVLVSMLLLGLLVGGCPGPTPAPSSSPSPSPSASTTSGESGVTVELVAHTGTDPEKPDMSASGDNNHIRWHNQTTVVRKIHFTVDWPFLESSGDISVAAGAYSPYYTLDPAKFTSGGRPFPYEVNPPLVEPTDGPDEPAISGLP